MATQLPDGRWQARHRPRNGAAKTFYGWSEAEADGKKAAYLRDVQGLPSESPTLSQFWDEQFLPSIQNLSRLSLRKYKDTFRLRIQPILGAKDLREIRYADCQNLINSLELAPASVRFAKSLLVTVFNHAERLEFVERNPARLVRVPARPRKRERVLTPPEVREVLRRTEGTSLALPVFLALVLGLRRSECCGLMWDDLDRIGMTLSIRRQVKSKKGDGGGTEITTLKTDSGFRVLPITPRILEEIEARGNLDSIWMDGKGDKPTDPENVGKRYRAARAKLGLPEEFTFHDLRRCAASLMEQGGVSLMVASKVLGHADPSMSAMYQTIQKEGAKEGIEAISGLIFDATGDGISRRESTVNNPRVTPE